MINIFKWYIVSDLDLFIEKDTAWTLSRRIKYLEKENENLYFENDRLRNKQAQVTNIIEPKDITLKNYISEDKIKEKLKELEKQEEKLKYDGNRSFADYEQFCKNLKFFKEQIEKTLGE